MKPQLHNSKQQQQNPLAQFSWNPATASIEPTWSTLNNVVATAAANVYGNPVGVPNPSNQQPWENTPEALGQPASWGNFIIKFLF